MKLQGKKIAVLAEDLYEDLELWYPYYRLKEEGANVRIVGPGAYTYKSKHGYPVKVDLTVDDVNADQFDAVIVPGGYAPDKMRRSQKLLDLVRNVFRANKPVAFICHGGWVPISAGIVEGRKVTSVAAIRDDLVNAGAEWIDQAVVRDGNLISSRTPADLPDFCREIIAAM